MAYITAVSSEIPVSQFVRWHKEGSLKLSPFFQRRSVWKPGARAYLIDTLLRGYPVPPIYLRNLPTNQKTFVADKQVVDGQQRLSSVLAFVDPSVCKGLNPAQEPFTLSAAHNEKYGNKTFEELPKQARQYLLDYPFRVYTFDASTSDATVLQIFARMNSTGVKVNGQELRNAEYFGFFKSLSYSLAEEYLQRWIDWKLFSGDQISRMAEVELTSDLLVLMIDGVTAKSQKMLDDVYEKYDDAFATRSECARRFRHIMDILEEGAGEEGLGALRQKTFFYAGFAALYDGAYSIESKLLRKAPRRIPVNRVRNLLKTASQIESGNAPQKVLDATTVRVTNLNSRTALVDYLSRAVRK